MTDELDGLRAAQKILRERIRELEGEVDACMKRIRRSAGC